MLTGARNAIKLVKPTGSGSEISVHPEGTAWRRGLRWGRFWGAEAERQQSSMQVPNVPKAPNRDARNVDGGWEWGFPSPMDYGVWEASWAPLAGSVAATAEYGFQCVPISQVCKRHRMPLVEMFVVNWRPVRRRLLTENIPFVRLKGNVPIWIYPWSERW